jgi:hypothetical protein
MCECRKPHPRRLKWTCDGGCGKVLEGGTDPVFILVRRNKGEPDDEQVGHFCVECTESVSTNIDPSPCGACGKVFEVGDHFTITQAMTGPRKGHTLCFCDECWADPDKCERIINGTDQGTMDEYFSNPPETDDEAD